MAFIQGPALTDEQFPIFAAIRQSYGFLPKFFEAQTSRTDLIAAEVAFSGSIIRREGALPRRLKEYIFLVCSARNLSTYCVTAHCAIVRMLGIQGPEPEQIAIDHHEADLLPADRALLDFAIKLNERKHEIAPADIEHLREAGFTDDQIREAIVMVSYAKFANVVNFGLGTVPDFHNPRVNFDD